MTGKRIERDDDISVEEEKARFKELDDLEEKIRKSGLLKIEGKSFQADDVLDIADTLSGNYNGITCFKRIVFEKCSFNNLKLFNRTFSIPFTFRECQFNRETRFENCKFNTDFSFEKSSFSNQTFFIKPILGKNVVGDFNDIKTQKWYAGRDGYGFIVDGDGKLYFQEKLSFRNAKFQCLTQFSNWNKLNLDFKDAHFRWHFFFNNVVFGPESLFWGIKYLGNDPSIPNHHQVKSLQGLSQNLRKSCFEVNAKLIDEMIEAFYRREETIRKNRNEEIKQVKEELKEQTNYYTEEQMCKNILKIGVAGFKKLKSHVNTGKIKDLKLPEVYNPNNKPIVYTEEEVLKFHKELKRWNEEKQARRREEKEKKKEEKKKKKS